MRTIAILMLLFGWSPARAQVPGYGELARTTALTAADDYRIGKGYVEMMSWMWGEVDDPELRLWVEDVTRRIVASSDRPDLIFNVRVVNDPDVNASALPGGFMIVNKGLLNALSRDQVAFVLAHEISHVELRHFATTMNMTRAMEVMNAGRSAMDAGEREGVTGAQAELARTMTAYGRHLELEADLYGMLYALRAGYPSDSGVGAMAAMKAVVGEVPVEELDGSTHPRFDERIDQLNKGLETIEETWGLFDAGVAYARDGSYEACVSAFQQFLTLFPRSSAAWSNVGTCTLRAAVAGFSADPWRDDLPVYTHADVTVRAGVDRAALERARAAFGKALSIDPNRDAALGNLGVLARLEGDYPSAERLLLDALELDPDYAGYLNNLGNVYAAQKLWKKAELWYGKALKADPGASYAVANRAMVLVLRGRGKQSAPLWEGLLGSPAYADQAFDQLVALGLREESQRPAKEAPAPDAAEGLIALLGALMESPAPGEAPDATSPAEEPTGSASPAEPAPPSSSTAEPAPPSPSPAEQSPPSPSPAEPAPPSASTAEPPEGARGADAVLGELKLGAEIGAFVALLGEPDFRDSQEDGYTTFAMWPGVGVTVVFVDGGAASIEVASPNSSRTARGIGVGSEEAAVLSAYGADAERWGDRNQGYYTLSYAAAGVDFSLDGSGAVQAFSIWAL